MEEIKKEEISCGCDSNCDCGTDCDCGCESGNDCGCDPKAKCRAKVAIIILSILVLGTIVVFSIIRDKFVNNNMFQISVVGQGKVTYVPDTANVTLGVQVDKAAKAEDALNQLNKTMNGIIEAVAKLGVDKGDIKTQNYNLSANYDYNFGTSKVSGYNANQAIVIKIKDLTKNQDLVSKVIAEATKSGANQVSGITFENSNIDNLKQEARIKAIENAKEKSKGMEESLGVKFGKIVGMWENTVSSPEMPYYADAKMGMGGAVTNISPVVPSGTQDVIVEVNVSYKIK